MSPLRTLVLAGCFAAAGIAAPATAQSFAELENRLRGHPALSALDQQARAGRERASAASALPDPVVSLGLNNFPIFDPSFDTYLPTNTALGIRQPIPNRAGREARAGEARAMSRQTETARAARFAALRSELITLLFDKQRIARQRAFAKDRNAKYDELADVIEAEIDAGRPAVFRLAEIEGERAGVARELVELDRQAAEIDARLIDLVGEVPRTPAPPVAPADWSGRAGDFHAVRTAQAAIRAAEYSVAAAEAAWKPDWGVGLTYQQRQAGSSFDGDDWVSGQVTFTVPLWAGQNQEPQLRAARAERASAELRYQAAARAAAARYAAEAAAIRAADQAIAVLERNVVAVEDEIDAQLTVYESGVGDYAPIIDGEIAILKLRAEIAAEQARRAGATARLNALLVTP